MTRPIVLTFTHYYLPGYKAGGPIQTIGNLVARLSDQFDFRVVTHDRDAGDTAPFPDVEVNRWQRVGSGVALYLPAQDWRLLRLRELIANTPHDVLYLNSFFGVHASLLPLLARRLLPKELRRPVVLAPRGEFSKGALGIKAPKKAQFLRVARTSRLYKSVLWQASSEYEAADIISTMNVPYQQVHVAPDLASVGAPTRGRNLIGERDHALRICFLSRITPMKNLPFCLAVLSKVRTPVEFTIAGFVDDDNHWSECKRLVKGLPSHVQARYIGHIAHKDVSEFLASQDLLFLPTFGENYGHVIIESLLVGTPVLISDQTPWVKLEESEVGWDLPLSQPERFEAAIHELASMSTSERANIRTKASAYARHVADDEGRVAANAALFTSALIR